MPVYSFTANRLDGSIEKLDAYRGQVLLIVNTASACGFTPQYAGWNSFTKNCMARA
jgi:glutathione peroxidase